MILQSDAEAISNPGVRDSWVAGYGTPVISEGQFYGKLKLMYQLIAIRLINRNPIEYPARNKVRLPRVV